MNSPLGKLGQEPGIALATAAGHSGTTEARDEVAPRPGWTPTAAARASLWLHAAGLLALGAVPAAWPWVLGTLAADHALLGLVGMRPRSRLLGANLSRLPPASAARGEVALTFDDGPDPAVTPAVLDLLEAAGATASFFLVGARAARHPGLVRAILRRGHSVENHTHHHPLLFAARGPWFQRRQILLAQAAIERAGGQPRFFRPPAGLRSPLLDPVLAGTGLHYVSWTRRGADAWLADPARVLRRLRRNLAAGDVLLLHDGTCRRDAAGRPVVLTVLPALLAALRRGGLSAVSLPRALDGPPAALAASPETVATAVAAAAAGSPASAGRASP